MNYSSTRESDPPYPNQKTALVLSSGGLFGAYQAGVWTYLAETSFRPDIVVGASAGAINGWAIAGGCDGAELAERWLDESQSNVLKRRANSGLRSGYFHHEPLQTPHLNRLLPVQAVTELWLGGCGVAILTLALD